MPRYYDYQLTEGFSSYQDAVEHVHQLEKDGKIRPLKNSGKNGKYPPLYRQYQTVETRRDQNQPLLDELRTKIMPPLSTAFYEHHLSQYKKDRNHVLALNDWVLRHGKPDPDSPVSINERSYQIFTEEKYLKSTRSAVLKRLGLPSDFLCCFDTYEPLISIYSRHKNLGQNILIVENLDSFVSIRKHLMEQGPDILNTRIDTVIYGAGFKIHSSFLDLLAYGESYLKSSKNTFYYLGDLDYEGITIFDGFKTRYPHCRIELFLPGYLKMIELAKPVDQLECMSENQHQTPAGHFWEVFDSYEHQRDFLKELFASNRYIPQEILTFQVISLDPPESVKETESLEQTSN